jgi:ferredoxin-NADP reductase
MELTATLPPAWDPDIDDTLVCRAVRDETHDVRTFVFGAPAPRLFRYKPGQFMTFHFAVDGAAIDRCYTLASTPTRPDLVSITVKRQPGGAVSPWLHATMRPGTAVRVTGPVGAFTCVDHPSRKYLFLSGGSGITPVMSMARAHDDLAGDADIIFVHNARSPADIIFRTELTLMAQHRPGFRFVPVCEADSASERWSGYAGRLSLAMLRLIAPDLLEREVFTCGPAPYMAAVRAMLTEAGFDFAHYHEESFDFATLVAEESEAEPVVPSGSGFRVEFAKSGCVVECDPSGFILDAGRKAGLRLPFSCTKGMCGTCKSKLISGEVDMKHGGGIRPREIAQGLILICCSRPLTDLVIER